MSRAWATGLSTWDKSSMLALVEVISAISSKSFILTCLVLVALISSIITALAMSKYLISKSSALLLIWERTSWYLPPLW